MTKRRRGKIGFVKFAMIIATPLVANGGFAEIPPTIQSSPTEGLPYADLADLFVGSPIALRARITSATRLKVPPRPSGAQRYYVEATVISLIRAPRALPPKLVWLVDILPDSRGKYARLAKNDVLVAALPVADRPGEIRLAAPDAQRFWSPALEARVRTLVADITAADAPPAITGVASAFHTAGTITGEGETQIFLSTVTKAPITITVLTRPAQPKQWAFAVGEIVDEAAAAPLPETLAWYRLACFLPPVMPDAAVSALNAADAEAARNDYAFVVRALGACPRKRQ